jgi:VWFA-related protein
MNRLLYLLAVLALTQQTIPRQTFETKTELVLVDVTVVDRDSNPVSTLKTEDFELQVNGAPRPIASLQFISAVPASTTPLTARETRFTSNDAQTTGRLLLFVVDESNMRTGSSKTVLRTAQALMDRLAPGDMIGLARLPQGIGGVEFTADRARIVNALQKVTGTVGNSGRIGPGRIRISEAYALETNDSGTWQNAIERECQGESGAGLEACATAAEGDARSLLIETSAHTRATLLTLENLLKSLVSLKTPVNIVMISEGLFVARDRSSMTELTRRAAEARATIHVIRPGREAFDIEERASPGLSAFFDDSLMTEGLDQVAGQTRGTMTQIGGSPQAAFDRLGRELSGYYLIGFEPTDDDRTGKERRIRVQVRPRGLTVRARPTFVIRNDTAATAAAATDAVTTTALATEQVKQLLVNPLPTRGLPMRVSSFTVTDAGSSKIRVVISAEIGDTAATEVEWPTGIMILDKDEKPVVSRVGSSKLAPASVRGDSPRLLLTSALLDPGEYTLRIAALDDAGHGGSVHHSINARLQKLPGQLNVSDLIIVPQPPEAGALPRPRPSGVVDTETISAMLEMTSTDKGALSRAKVSVQIADGDNGQPLVTVEARQAPRGEGQRSYAATLKLGVLPPGEYIARAIITMPGQPEQRLTRPFLLAPVAKAAESTPIDTSIPIDPDAPAVPLPEIKILAPVPRFLPETVLTTGVVRPFLDGLSDLHPPSDTVEAIVEEARNGKYEAPDVDSARAADDELNLAFIRGLDALKKGNIQQASAWFQQTLKGA